MNIFFKIINISIELKNLFFRIAINLNQFKTKTFKYETII